MPSPVVAYLRVVRRPHVRQLLIGGWIGRLPSAMAAIAIPLTLRHAGLPYTFVGTVVGVYALSSAIAAPVIGRLVDRVGQPKVLVPTGLLSTVGFALIALVPSDRTVVRLACIL